MSIGFCSSLMIVAVIVCKWAQPTHNGTGSLNTDDPLLVVGRHARLSDSGSMAVPIRTENLGLRIAAAMSRPRGLQ